MKKEVYEKCKAELIEKGMADDGIVGVARIYDMPWYNVFTGLLGSITTEVGKYDMCFCMQGMELLVIPYMDGELNYDQMFKFHKDDIVKFKGWNLAFKIKTKKKTYSYQIRREKPAFKEIRKRLG